MQSYDNDDESNNKNNTSHHDSSGVGLDFLGNGSMKDIAMKMGDIDKVLDEIHQLDDGKPEGSGCLMDEMTANYEKENSNDIVVSTKDGASALKDTNTFTDGGFDDNRDDDDNDEDDIAGMSDDAFAQMQAELKQVEETEREKQQQQQLQEKQQRQQQVQAPPPPPPLSTPPQPTMFGATVTAIAIKPTFDSSIGISMKTSKGLTWIVGVSENGLLKDSQLKGEMTMLLKSINGVPVKNARHGRSVIQGAHRKVKIVAQEILKQ
ncbi:MAG: hypothetical protein SGARI_002628 [Bacillariaceae sp.]